jgi:hypothetical protein
MIRRRTAEAGLKDKLGWHVFRATAIAAPGHPERGNRDHVIKGRRFPTCRALQGRNVRVRPRNQACPRGSIILKRHTRRRSNSFAPCLGPVARRLPAAALPEWIPPQLAQLVDAAPKAISGCTKSNSMATACMHARSRCGEASHPHRARPDPYIRQSPRPWRRSTRARSISTASCTASSPTALPRSV